MNTAVTTLKLVLERLRVSTSISTLADRKRVQKAIELVQGAGIDLGYSFGWYIRGPYSPALTRDYFALDEATEGDEASSTASYELRSSVVERLDRLRPILDVPNDVPIEQPEWLELLASVDYLQRVRRLDADRTNEVIRSKKSHIAAYLPQARAALAAGGLLG